MLLLQPYLWFEVVARAEYRHGYSHVKILTETQLLPSSLEGDAPGHRFQLQEL